MTVMFCDMKGFTALSEGMTPQGLVKVMNRYLSTMSEPIRAQQGIIDKYIGDAIMAYWGPPFTDEAEEARLACLAAIDMMERMPALRKELPELLGVRAIPTECDLRIGIATGEVLVGSIGSEFMMSFTVMGDTVNLASRLEAANKFYGTRCLVSQATAAASARRSSCAKSTAWWSSARAGRRPCSRSWASGRAVAQSRRIARALCRGACRIPRAPLGRGARRVQRGAGSRRPATVPRARCSPASRSSRPIRRRRLGRRLADGAEIAVLPAHRPRKNCFYSITMFAVTYFSGLGLTVP